MDAREKREFRQLRRELRQCNLPGGDGAPYRAEWTRLTYAALRREATTADLRAFLDALPERLRPRRAASTRR